MMAVCRWALRSSEPSLARGMREADVAQPDLAQPDRPGSPRSVELWFVDLNSCAEALNAVETATPRLDKNELKKIAGSASPAAAAERRASYIALRILIERFWGPAWRTVAYTLTGSGKPTLTGLDGSFSLAHVDRFALIGLARARTIGVDLEPDRQPTVADRRRVRIESAAIALARGAALPQSRQPRFLQAWVRLEAVAKADGRGIGRLLTGLSIIGPDPADGPEFSADYAHEIATRFWLQDVAVSNSCVAAVALDGELPSGLSAMIFPSAANAIESIVSSAKIQS